MRLLLTLTDGRRAEHVEVVAEAPCAWSEVAAVLPQGWPTDPRSYAVATPAGSSEPVPAAAVVGRPPLLHGATLCLTTTRARPREEPTRSPAEVRVVEGPDCGACVPLPAGAQVSIGRDPSCGLVVADEALSRHDCTVLATRAGVVVTDTGSTNGAVISDVTGQRRVTSQTPWSPGERLHIGGSVLELVHDPAVPLHRVPDGEGRLVVTPVPWGRSSPGTVEVRLPPAPEQPVVTGPPVLGWLLPLLVSLGLAVMLRMPLLVLFGLMAPAMALGSHLGERRQRRTEHARACSRHAEVLRERRMQVSRAVAADVALTRAGHPDLARWWVTVREGPCRPLWSRSPTGHDDEGHDGRPHRGLPDEDRPPRLVVRLGRGEEPTSVRLDDVPVVGRDVPVLLEWSGVLGLVGPVEHTRALARSLLTQVLLAYDPATLRLVLTRADAEWEWLAWAPHLRDRRQHTALVLDDRLAGAPAGHDRGAASPAVPAAAALGLRLAATSDALGRVDHLVEVVDAWTAVLHVGALGRPFSPDLLTAARAARTVRRTAPWTTVAASEGDRQTELPDEVTLPRVLPEAADAASLRRRWREAPRSTRCVLGLGPAGPVAVDLAVDGPHALVAGTTGAGKSELLRTLVTSLAVVNRPDELVMVLVDYKGGSAFADCAALPHCVGLVTDLDPHLADRALTSLGAELKRRERLMARVGARDLTGYRATDPETGLPRLVIVIDEFRALAEELPGFVDGLVRVAALGRSLGIHLVLATQRPAGIVSADVRANMNLRIALRLRDTSDSLDVLDSPAAAALPEGVPGRALLRTGAEAPRLVQVARVAGSAGEADPARGPRVRPVPGPWVGEEADELSTDSSTPGLLPSVVTAVTEAASALGAAAPASPWLPPLPTVLTAAEVPDAQVPDAQVPDAETPVPGRARPFAVPWGLLDLPGEQRQAPACWDPVQESHLAVVGAPGAGATTLVRTVLGGLLQRHDPGRLHLYCFDSGSGLTVLGAAPHTGALVTPEEPTRTARVLARLVATLQERRQALAAAGLTSYAEQSAGPDPWPLLVWVVDGWGRFAGAQAEQGRGAGLEAALRLLAEGPAVGIVAVVTGDRTLLTGRVSASLPCVWALRLADPTDLMLAGLRREQIPDTMPPGRAVRTRDGVTAQVAVLGDDPAGASQVAALATTVDRHVHRATAVPADRRPWRVVGLPTRCALWELTGSRPHGAAGGHREPLLGLGGDEGGPTALALSPERGDAALVLGPPGSGRSTVLDTLAEELRRSGHRVVRVAPGRAAADLADELARGPGPCVLVDDAEQLADTAVEEVVLRWAVSLTSGSAAHAGARAPGPRGPGTGGPGALVVAAETERAVTAYRGLVPLAARSRTGVVLQPRGAGDGGPLGVSVPTGEPALPGRGVLVHRGTCQPVQVALPGQAP